MLRIVTYISRGRGYFTKQLRNVKQKIENLKCFLGSLVRYKIAKLKFMDQIPPVDFANDNLLI